MSGLVVATQAEAVRLGLSAALAAAVVVSWRMGRFRAVVPQATASTRDALTAVLGVPIVRPDLSDVAGCAAACEGEGDGDEAAAVCRRDCVDLAEAEARLERVRGEAAELVDAVRSAAREAHALAAIVRAAAEGAAGGAAAAAGTAAAAAEEARAAAAAAVRQAMGRLGDAVGALSRRCIPVEYGLTYDEDPCSAVGAAVRAAVVDPLTRALDEALAASAAAGQVVDEAAAQAMAAAASRLLTVAEAVAAWTVDPAVQAMTEAYATARSAVAGLVSPGALAHAAWAWVRSLFSPDQEWLYLLVLLAAAAVAATTVAGMVWSVVELGGAIVGGGAGVVALTSGPGGGA